MTNELAKVEERGALMRPVARPDDLISAHKEIADIVVKVLQRDTDYGTIPGTKTKPVLLKAGAERLAIAFGLTPTYVVTDRKSDPNMEVKYQKKEWLNRHRGDKAFRMVDGTAYGHYEYEVRCDLVNRASGEVVGSANGVCSTMESKYVDRPRDCQNTVLKMAQKRALVGAVLHALGLSDRFTQDVEDFAHAEPEPEPAAEKLPEGWAEFVAARDAGIERVQGAQRAFVEGMTSAIFIRLSADKRTAIMSALTQQAVEPPAASQTLSEADLDAALDGEKEAT